MIKILTCFLVGCVIVTLSAKIPRLLNGQRVGSEGHRKYYRFVVKVFVGDYITRRMCTGTLVTRDLVLLSAHCFCGYDGDDLYIRVVADVETMAGDNSGYMRLGSRILNSRLKKPICKLSGKTILPPTGNDVALIRLHTPYYDITPVPVWCGSVPDVSDVRMIGFGIDEHGIKGTLRLARATTVQCPPNWPNKPICVGIEKDTPVLMPGDSGGPLIAKVKGRFDGRFYQIGVSRSVAKSSRVSHGFQNFSVFENVAIHCKWIRTKISVGHRSSVEMTMLTIQPFVVFIVLSF